MIRKTRQTGAPTIQYKNSVNKNNKEPRYTHRGKTRARGALSRRSVLAPVHRHRAGLSVRAIHAGMQEMAEMTPGWAEITAPGPRR